ncbi:MAG: tetratricopeptide repeat protein [Terracidiphilus sp.]
MAERHYTEARSHLASARDAYGVTAPLDAAIGEAHLRIGQWSEAAEAFHSAIAADPGIAAAHQGLAQALFEQHLFDQSAEAALDAIRLRYDAPVPHRILGHCLRALGREDAASQEFAAAQRVSGSRAL